MLLAIDIGNTNIEVGFMEGGQVAASYRLTTRIDHTADEFGLLLGQLMALAGYRTTDVQDAIISSVAPAVMHAVRSCLIRFFSIDPMVVGPGVKTGMNIRLDDPRSLGADCLADCVGAFHRYGGPVLVIDFGTATTFNYVDERGAIRSGLIVPGIRSGAQALAGQTAQLPQVEITRPQTIMATGTRTAMQAGLYYNFLGGLERIIRQYRSEIGRDFHVVATGGMGRTFSEDTDLIEVYDPELIFAGMHRIHQLNADGRLHAAQARH
ncbi:type III pantothenate kinase [uncultured Bifidobacterium sp.]|uniref:type III pantothenate kinase n=1 Tax=uncultured Bifidobacterium sp. TaxID=165187 RepID=UPI0025E37175|nr:type III pantothenate kinase [uncultured Bifidobacterium sp.]